MIGPAYGAVSSGILPHLISSYRYAVAKTSDYYKNDEQEKNANKDVWELKTWRMENVFDLNESIDG